MSRHWAVKCSEESESYWPIAEDCIWQVLFMLWEFLSVKREGAPLTESSKAVPMEIVS